MMFAMSEYINECAQRIENATILVTPSQQHLRDGRQSSFLNKEQKI